MTKTVFLITRAGMVGRRLHRPRGALAWLAGQLGRETPQNCNIVGEPRIGKTSLLHAVYRRKVGLPRGPDRHLRVGAPGRMGRSGTSGVLGAVAGPAVRSHHALRGITLARHATKPGDPVWQTYQALDDALERLRIEHPLVRVVVLIDDFELLIPGITAEGLDWLRALATRFSSLFAMVVTSNDPLEQVCRPLGAEQVSPLPNIFATHHLSLLTEEETTSLISAAANAEDQLRLTPH